MSTIFFNIFPLYFHRPTQTCTSFSDCMSVPSADGWKWMGENPSDAVEIDVSHDAAVNSMTIDNPSNCVALVSNLRLQDENCSIAVYPHICTISYNAVSGLGASIGKILM